MSLTDAEQKIAEITLDGEYFKQVTFAPNYYVSNMGRVYGVYQNKVLSPEFNRYEIVFIKDSSGCFKHYRVHRLVAELFCSKNDEQDIVHHIDRDTKNNSAVNLLWCTYAEHIEIHNKLRKKRED